MSKPTEISLTGMTFHVPIGILSHEREIAQPLEIDLVVRHTRDVSDVLDYRDLYELVAATVFRDDRTYLETLAEQIASAVLILPGVHSCRVSARKPHVALEGSVKSAGVSIERTRD